MPQIGWSELLVIIVLAVLIIGPKDLPVVVKKITSSIKKIAAILNIIITTYFLRVFKYSEVIKPTFAKRVKKTGN